MSLALLPPKDSALANWTSRPVFPAALIVSDWVLDTACRSTFSGERYKIRPSFSLNGIWPMDPLHPGYYPTMTMTVDFYVSIYPLINCDGTISGTESYIPQIRLQFYEFGGFNLEVRCVQNFHGVRPDSNPVYLWDHAGPICPMPVIIPNAGQMGNDAVLTW